jgi:hypothetical protein
MIMVTAETREAEDRARGELHVYGPGDTHDKADVWWGPGAAPDGVWISRCGDWRTVRD